MTSAEGATRLPPVCVLAGGMGTRLGPLAEREPKAMVTVAGEPFLVHQLRLLRDRGADRVVLCVGHMADRIERVIGCGHELGVRVSYAYDPPGLAGTAGAVRGAVRCLGEHFLVLYGDTYLRIDYRDFARKFIDSGREAQMSVLHNKGAWGTSNTEVASGLVSKHDKLRPDPGMQWIDYGLGAFRATVFARGPGRQASDLSTVYKDLAATGDLGAYVATQRFYEIGTPDALAETDSFLRSVRPTAE